MKQPTAEALKARARRLADKYTKEKCDAEPGTGAAVFCIEDNAAKAKRYVSAQCKARKAEVARGKVSTLSRGAKA